MKGKSFKEGLDIQILRATENFQMKIYYTKTWTDTGETNRNKCALY